MNLTFKQYLESKTQLVEAVNSIPKATKIYNVRKYCTLPIGTCLEDKQIVSLKPNQRIIIEWIYNNVNEPDISYVKFDGVNQISDDPQEMFWSSKKLQKWLLRYTTQISE